MRSVEESQAGRLAAQGAVVGDRGRVVPSLQPHRRVAPGSPRSRAELASRRLASSAGTSSYATWGQVQLLGQREPLGQRVEHLRRRAAVDENETGVSAARAGQEVRRRRRSTPPAAKRWSSTSSRSARSPRCWRTPPSTPPSPPQGRRKRRAGPVPAHRTRRARCLRTGLHVSRMGQLTSSETCPTKATSSWSVRREASSCRVDDVDVERRGDSRSAVAVTFDAHRRRVVEHQLVLANPVGPVVAAPDLFPGQVRVLAAYPIDHPPPGVVDQVGEGLLGCAVAEVGHPTPQDRVGLPQQLPQPQRGRRWPRGLLDLAHDPAQRLLGRDREYQPVVEVDDVRLLDREGHLQAPGTTAPGAQTVGVRGNATAGATRRSSPTPPPASWPCSRPSSPTSTPPWLELALTAGDVLAWTPNRAAGRRTRPRPTPSPGCCAAARITRGSRRVWLRLARGWPWRSLSPERSSDSARGTLPMAPPIGSVIRKPIEYSTPT